MRLHPNTTARARAVKPLALDDTLRIVDPACVAGA